ncbi:MAG: 2-iminoacetate synthase ThiH [Pseudomonadota bacterium]
MRPASFGAWLAQLDPAALAACLQRASPSEVARVLEHDQLGLGDLPLLLSPAAEEHLGRMVARASALTEQRFGRVMQLYAPLYLSSACTNRCLYCGFAADVRTPRRHLSLDEAVANAEVLHREGFRQILLVTGEAPAVYGVDDMAAVARAIGGLFDAISVEVYPLEVAEYRTLAAAGVDGLALYQETYDRPRYARLHPAGRKADFEWRLTGPDRGGQAGFRSLGLGVLLGLAPWREDVVALAAHATWLQQRHWRSRIALSFPRLVPSERGFTPEVPVSDRALLQAMAALRLVLPDAEIVLSTREPAALRDRLLETVVTRMSAGSRTSPGGYLDGGPDEQFQAQDTRPPAEIARLLAARRYEPVWKDLDKGFRP